MHTSCFSLHRLAGIFMLGCLLLSSCSYPPADSSGDISVEDLDAVRFPPKEPAEVQETFDVQDGFRMELIASEPLVYDPVTMVYDENGRAYVAEMSDYPYTDAETAEDWSEQTNQAPIGRIRLLEDTNGDGTFDESTIFAEDLSWPTGLGVWKGGLFVLATPHIWYMKDTDGDRKADTRRKVYTGFRKFNVQAVMNNLHMGLDHQFYGAGSSNGGMIRPAHQPEAEPVEMSRSDFRFDPARSGTFDVISGGARFGNSFDDWYNRFICDIRNPVQHVVLPDRYLERNPYLPVPSALHDVAKAGDQIPVYRISPPEPWRAIRARRRSSDPDYEGTPRSEMKAGGYWTSSSGITIYRGAAYPEAYQGDVFIGEVANNIIHRQDREKDGVTFTSTRADRGAEFVASTDTWFRAVNLVNAPDGTLHVMDMYREVIEHPWSIPDDILDEINLRSGTDRGRIYRLAPPDFEAPAPPRLGEATTEELVATLENPNGWWRDTAHRLLYERQDTAAVSPLRRLLRESSEPLARMHALWSLQGLEALRENDIARGLSDPSAGVRRQAVRLAESHLNASPRLFNRLLELAGDPSTQVRFQVAFSLGETDDPRALPALARIAKRDAGSLWMRTAVLSSVPTSSGRMLAELMRDSSFASSPAARQLMSRLAQGVGARNETPEVNRVLTALAAHAHYPPATQNIVLEGLGNGLGRAGTNLRTVSSALSSKAARYVDRLLFEAQQNALDSNHSTGRRRQAIRLLAYDDFSRVDSTLARLLTPRQPPEIQLAAVHTLSALEHDRVSQLLINAWEQYTPAVRRESIEALMARPKHIQALLDVVEAGSVSAAQLSATTKSRLTEHDNAAIRSRAQKLFTGASAGREKVVASYQPALDLEGDKTRGQKIFKQQCQSCHRLGERQSGHGVGPNLASIQHKTADELLVHILDPNREVSADYMLYEVRREDGQTATGIITDETPSSITLVRPGNVQETILRDNIEAITSSGLSLMPEGLEASISQQDMADLLSFVLAPPQQE